MLLYVACPATGGTNGSCLVSLYLRRVLSVEDVVMSKLDETSKLRR